MTQTQIIDKKVIHASRRKRLRTAKQAKAYLKSNGLTVPAFAKKNGFTEKTVYRVLNGEIRGNYGESHAICVALGMKKPDPEVTV